MKQKSFFFFSLERGICGSPPEGLSEPWPTLHGFESVLCAVYPLQHPWIYLSSVLRDDMSPLVCIDPADHSLSQIQDDRTLFELLLAPIANVDCHAHHTSRLPIHEWGVVCSACFYGLFMAREAENSAPRSTDRWSRRSACRLRRLANHPLNRPTGNCEYGDYMNYSSWCSNFTSTTITIAIAHLPKASVASLWCCLA